jgi:hypothetical protein
MDLTTCSTTQFYETKSRDITKIGQYIRKFVFPRMEEVVEQLRAGIVSERELALTLEALSFAVMDIQSTLEYHAVGEETRVRNGDWA